MSAYTPTFDDAQRIPREDRGRFDIDVANAPDDPQLGCCLCDDPECPGENHYVEPEWHRGRLWTDLGWRKRRIR